MSDEHRSVTQAEVAEAVNEGMRGGIAALAAALKSGQASAVTVRTNNHRSTHPLAIFGIAVTLAIPMGGWIMSVSSRLSIVESKQSSLETAATEIAALQQEIKDFREEFERWQLRADPAASSLDSFRRQFTDKDAK